MAQGGGGFSNPLLPTLDFVSPLFGAPPPPDAGAELEGLFEQPAASPKLTIKPANNTILRMSFPVS